MTMRNLNDLYRRVINSHTRLRQLRQMRAPDVVVRNEIRLLQDAMRALSIDDEITQIIDHVGTGAFVRCINSITGTEFKFPIAAAPALHADCPVWMRRTVQCHSQSA